MEHHVYEPIYNLSLCFSFLDLIPHKIMKSCNFLCSIWKLNYFILKICSICSGAVKKGPLNWLAQSIQWIFWLWHHKPPKIPIIFFKILVLLVIMSTISPMILSPFTECQKITHLQWSGSNLRTLFSKAVNFTFYFLLCLDILTLKQAGRKKAEDLRWRNSWYVSYA